MSYNVVTTEGVRTFENIDDAGDYAQAMSLRTGEPAKVFHAIKAENEEEKTQLKTSAVAICNLIIDFFDGEVQEMKAAKE